MKLNVDGRTACVYQVRIVFRAAKTVVAATAGGWNRPILMTIKIYPMTRVIFPTIHRIILLINKKASLIHRIIPKINAMA